MQMQSSQYQQTLTSLLAGFQCAILDMTMAIKQKMASVSADSLESANYVIGMTVMNSANCERILSWEQDTLEHREAEVCEFIKRGQAFLRELNNSGFGIV